MRWDRLAHDPGVVLLDTILAVAIVGIVVTTCLPAWWSQYHQINQLITQTRNAQELNWMVSRICDDIRFNSSSATYQYDGTRVRRIVNGATQIMNTVPITSWQSPSNQNGYGLIIQTQHLRRVCQCPPWKDGL